MFSWTFLPFFIKSTSVFKVPISTTLSTFNHQKLNHPLLFGTRDEEINLFQRHSDSRYFISAQLHIINSMIAMVTTAKKIQIWSQINLTLIIFFPCSSFLLEIATLSTIKSHCNSNMIFIETCTYFELSIVYVVWMLGVYHLEEFFPYFDLMNDRKCLYVKA